MYNSADYCSECEYLNTKDSKDGKYRCTRKDTYKASNCKDAQYCDQFGKKSTYHPIGSLWHITTVVVNILGLGYNCKELTAMKKLRNEYMENNPKYAAVLAHYDILGPKIASAIASLPWEQAIDEAAKQLIYIRKSTDYVEKGDYESAIKVYMKMTDDLSLKYLSVPFDLDTKEKKQGMVKQKVLLPIDKKHTRL